MHAWHAACLSYSNCLKESKSFCICVSHSHRSVNGSIHLPPLHSHSHLHRHSRSLPNICKHYRAFAGFSIFLSHLRIAYMWNLSLTQSIAVLRMKTIYSLSLFILVAFLFHYRMAVSLYFVLLSLLDHRSHPPLKLVTL